MRNTIILFLFTLQICFGQQGVTASNGMVVSAREEASKIGVYILKKGGNSFDAMIATH